MFALKIVEDTLKESQIPIESAIQSLHCSFEEPRLELSTLFWPAYSKANQYQESIYRNNSNVQSLENRALSNILAVINYCEINNQSEYLSFLQTLLEDIRKYGSLPDYTLRKLAIYDIVKMPNKILNFFKIVQDLKEILGESYLLNLKKHLHYKNSEIIIAEEMQTQA